VFHLLSIERTNIAFLALICYTKYSMREQGSKLPVVHIEIGVATSSIVHAPERGRYIGPLENIARLRARRNPGNVVPDWDINHNPEGRNGIKFVRMNSAADDEFYEPGILLTGKVNGCTVVMAAYRDSGNLVHAYMGHYDDNAIRETDDTGQLKISGQLRKFAGDHPIKVAIAYSKEHHEPPRIEQYEPEEYPIAGLLDDCQDLAPASDVITIPYMVNRDLDTMANGHTGAVGQSNLDSMYFSWNDHKVEIGQTEEFTEARRLAAKAAVAGYQEQYEHEHDSLTNSA
jgi:hypothetical protein